MQTILTREEEGIRDIIISKIQPKEVFSVQGIHAEYVVKPMFQKYDGGTDLAKSDALRADFTKRGVYSNILLWFLEQKFVEGTNKSVPYQELVLSEKGETLWAYGTYDEYRKSLFHPTHDEIIKLASNVISLVPMHGEFTGYCPTPILSFYPSDSDSEPVFDHKITLKERIISNHRSKIESEHVLRYLVNNGFAVNRHDIKERGNRYRELTDKGRELKMCGSIEAYNAKVAERLAAEEAEKTWRTESSRRQHQLAELQTELSSKQTRLAHRQLFVNWCIAIATAVAAVYYTVEMCKVDGLTSFLLILLLGTIFGLIIGLLLIQLRSKRK